MIPHPHGKGKNQHRLNAKSRLPESRLKAGPAARGHTDAAKWAGKLPAQETMSRTKGEFK
jgi:hypothetical protein